jgi:hypothetical protein
VATVAEKCDHRRVKTMVSTENEAPSEGHAQVYRDRIFKLLRPPGFDSAESIPR